MFHEIAKAIGDTLKDDATLVALLSSENAIVYGLNPEIDFQSITPAIRFFLVGEVPDTNRSALGVHTLRYQIDAIADDPVRCAQILDRIDQVLPIPWQVTELSTATWIVRRFHRLMSEPIQLQAERAGGGGKIQLFTTDWTLTALRKS